MGSQWIVDIIGYPTRKGFSEETMFNFKKSWCLEYGTELCGAVHAVVQWNCHFMSHDCCNHIGAMAVIGIGERKLLYIELSQHHSNDWFHFEMVITPH